MYYRRTKAANTIFLISAGVAYMLNAVFHLFLWRTPLNEVVTSIILPLVLVAGMWHLDWQLKLCPFMHQGVRYPIVWNIALALLTVVVCVLFHDDMDVSPALAILPIHMLAMIPYLYGSYLKPKDPAIAMAAIGITSLFFVVTLSFLEYNISGILVVVVATVTLFWAFRSMSWVYDVQNLTRKCTIATAVFLIAVTAFVIFAPPIRENLKLVTLGGRPSLGSSDYENSQCALLFEQANLWGLADIVIFPYSFFNRTFAAMLANYGWIPYILFVLTAATMLLSGGYLTMKQFGIQKFYVVGAYCIFAMQIIGCFITSCGWDGLLFPEMMPLMTNDPLLNVVYLLCCSLIVQVKQIPIEDDEVFWYD